MSYSHDLEQMFQVSVNGTINLVRQQLTLVKGLDGKVNVRANPIIICRFKLLTCL